MTFYFTERNEDGLQLLLADTEEDVVVHIATIHETEAHDRIIKNLLNDYLKKMIGMVNNEEIKE